MCGWHRDAIDDPRILSFVDIQKAIALDHLHRVCCGHEDLNQERIRKKRNGRHQIFEFGLGQQVRCGGFVRLITLGVSSLRDSG